MERSSNKLLFWSKKFPCVKNSAIFPLSSQFTSCYVTKWINSLESRPGVLNLLFLLNLAHRILKQAEFNELIFLVLANHLACSRVPSVVRVPQVENHCSERMANRSKTLGENLAEELHRLRDWWGEGDIWPSANSLEGSTTNWCCRSNQGRKRYQRLIGNLRARP